jgi:hypothetical protein
MPDANRPPIRDEPHAQADAPADALADAPFADPCDTEPAPSLKARLALFELRQLVCAAEAQRRLLWRPAPPAAARLCRLARCRRHGRCQGTAEGDLCPLEPPASCDA